MEWSLGEFILGVEIFYPGDELPANELPAEACGPNEFKGIKGSGRVSGVVAWAWPSLGGCAVL